MPNILSGFGRSAARQIVIRFVADTAHASRGMDKMKNDMLRMSTISGAERQRYGRMGMLPGYGPWMPRGGLDKNKDIEKFKRSISATGDATDKATRNISIFGAKLSIATVGLVAFGMAAIKFTERIFHYGSMIEQSKMVLTAS